MRQSKAGEGGGDASRARRRIRVFELVGTGQLTDTEGFRMEFRSLGKTGLQLSALSFGASSLGAEFRQIDINEAMRAVHVALDRGMNFIDTSPFYGRGMSEVLLGPALKEIPRDRYYIGTKLGRYDKDRFDFSAKRVAESVDVSLHRLGVSHLDICLMHDVEFVDLRQIILRCVRFRKPARCGSSA